MAGLSTFQAAALASNSSGITCAKYGFATQFLNIGPNIEPSSPQVAIGGWQISATGSSGGYFTDLRARLIAVDGLGLTGPSFSLIDNNGATGPTGAEGPTGERGFRGVTGEVGPTGERGERGFIGPEGPTGAQGLQGLTGPLGPTGPISPGILMTDSGTTFLWPLSVSCTNKDVWTNQNIISGNILESNYQADGGVITVPTTIGTYVPTTSPGLIEYFIVYPGWGLNTYAAYDYIPPITNSYKNTGNTPFIVKLPGTTPTLSIKIYYNDVEITGI